MKLLRQKLSKNTPIVIKGFLEFNHTPHVFEINEKNKLEGEINDTDLKGIYCKKKGCNLKFEDHKYDLKLILSLNRDTSQDEAGEELVKLKKLLVEFKIKTVAFVESEEKFRFI